jgi:fucose permease
VALNQFLWINFVTLSSNVATAYKVSTFDVGILAIVFPIVYVIISIPSGLIIDKKGYKFSLLVGAVFMTIFAAVRAAQNTYTFLLIGQIGIAVAQPFFNNSVSKLATTEFSSEKVPIIIGLGSLALFVGVAMGMILPPIMLLYMNLTQLIYITTIASVFIFIIFLISLLLIGKTKEKITEEKSSTSINFLKILRTQEILIFAIIAFVGMGIFNGFLTWIESILTHFNLNDIQIGVIGLTIVVAGTIGSIIIPALVTKFHKRKIFLLLAFAVSTPILVIFVFVYNFYLLIIITALLGFFMLGAFPVLIDWGTLLSGPQLAGSTTSLIWFLGQIGGFIIPIVMGDIGPLSPNNTYFYALLFDGIMFLLLLPLILKLKDRST